MSLKLKVVAIIAIATVLFVAAQYAAQRLVVLPRFLELEREDARQTMVRVVRALEREVEHLDRMCRNWAFGDDAVDFVESGSPAYIERNLPESVFTDASLNWIQYFKDTGWVRWRGTYDIDNDDLREYPELPDKWMPPRHLLLNPGPQSRPIDERSTSGVWMLQGQPMLVAARPILPDDHGEPARGTLVLGRFLTEPYIAQLSRQTSTELQIRPADRADLHLLLQQLLAIDEELPIVVETPSSTRLEVHALVHGIGGDAALILSTDVPRHSSAKGLESVRMAQMVTIIAGIAIMAIILLGMRETILTPVAQLTEHARSIQESGDFASRLTLARDDEFGVLADAYDQMLERIEQQTDELAWKNHELYQLAIIDGLTQVANRRYFDESLKREWDRARSEDRPLALALFDVDFFKNYNDVYGHADGDECLQWVAKTMRAEVKAARDLVARYGGEEFAILLPETRLDDALIIADGVRRAIEALGIEHSGSEVADRVTISAGVAAAHPANGSSPEILLQLADDALYRSKEDGRNRVSAAPEQR